MTGEQFFEVLGEVDGRFVSEARSEAGCRRPAWRKWATAAACLCLAVGVVLSVRGPHDGIVSGYHSFKSGCYICPEPGTYFCHLDVDEARAHYAGRDVQFLLAFDLFKGEGGREKVSPEELSAEYQRLTDLGYQFYEVEAWTYQEMMEKKYYTVVVGLFTEEQLAAFPASPDYGYAFHFVRNGDSSAIRIDEDDLVTGFLTNHS